jgi:hypothetical protein
VFFISQSIRSIGTDNIIPNIMPISLSVPFGDFSTGQGYLVDLFAMSMAMLLAWLLKRVTFPNVYEKRD